MRIDINVARNQASRVGSLSGDLRHVSTDLNQVMNETAAAWKDNAGKDFIKKCEELKGDIDRASKAIEDLATAINDVADQIHREDLEEERRRQEETRRQEEAKRKTEATLNIKPKWYL